MEPPSPRNNHKQKKGIQTEFIQPKNDREANKNTLSDFNGVQTGLSIKPETFLYTTIYVHFRRVIEIGVVASTVTFITT